MICFVDGQVCIIIIINNNERVIIKLKSVANKSKLAGRQTSSPKRPLPTRSKQNRWAEVKLTQI